MNELADKTLTAAFTGGGTGGHIYPGLAVADALRSLCLKNGVRLTVVWIGNASGMDKNIVEKNIGQDGRKSADLFYGIPSGKLRRYFSFRNFFDLFKIAGGCFASFFILLKIKPAFLFSKGGFVSVPPCFAAKILKIPVFTHECDFTPGLATKLNSRFAQKILLSYKETADYLSAPAKLKTLVTGNPVRPSFYSASAERGRRFANVDDKKPLLLVIGGSLGARQINALVEENLDRLCERFTVIHQTGAKNSAAEARAYSETVKRNYRPFPFIYDEMPDVIAAADVVLSRAGANSLWECSALGKPMILIPLSGEGTRGDQEDNAAYFEKRGAAAVLSGGDATSENLMRVLTRFLDAGTRQKYAEASASLSDGKNPAETIAKILYNRLVR
ncbi:MAG: undecaprenyldiphospho-muramoylpentapeptide beta-N-acetylglucosaminyltransferase [Treponema sp.]